MMPLYPPASGGAVATGDGIWWAPDQGFLGWAFPALVGNTPGTFCEPGTVGFSLVKCVESGTVGHLAFGHGNLAGEITADQSFLGIYEATVADDIVTELTLVAHTAAGTVDADFNNTSGYHFFALEVPLHVVAGQLYYVGLVYNSGGPALSVHMDQGEPETFPEVVPGAAGIYPFGITSNAGAYIALPSPYATDTAGTLLYNWAFWVAFAP